MGQNIKGEANIYSQNGFTGVNLDTGATIVYRNVRRKQPAPVVNPTPGPIRDTGNATPGAQPVVQQPAPVQNYQTNTQGTTTTALPTTNDLRTIIKVPLEYVSGKFTEKFKDFGGVLFPLTPQITLESKAEYTSMTPLHSNYPLNFYKNSGISDITLTAPFTVQNDDDAYYYLGMVRILTALTKMRFGASDRLAGSPPPVCRLYAYGEYVLKNVPVVITSVRHDLPDDVDFYTTSVLPGETVSVPTKATFTVGLKPTYSRQEMASVTVGAFLNNAVKGQGYL